MNVWEKKLKWISGSKIFYQKFMTSNMPKIFFPFFAVQQPSGLPHCSLWRNLPFKKYFTRDSTLIHRNVKPLQSTIKQRLRFYSVPLHKRMNQHFLFMTWIHIMWQIKKCIQWKFYVNPFYSWILSIWFQWFVCQKYFSKLILAWFSIQVHSYRRQSSMESIDDVEIWPHSTHKGYALTIEPSKIQL